MYRRPVFYILLVICIVFLTACVLCIGAVDISLSDVISTLTGGEVKESYRYIVLHSRLPLALTSIMAGSALSASGLMMQTTFRNPLAGPSILGVSSGASLGVALLSLPVAGYLAGSALPIVGAIAGATAVVVMLSMFSGFMRSGLSLLIVGIMISYLCSAIISLLNFFAPATDVKQFAVWGMGSFSSVTLDTIPLPAISVAVLLFASLCMSKPLNALLLGERYAASMGYSVRSIRTLLLATAGLLTAIVTAYCGPVGFIGLIVPHIARMTLASSSHSVIMPASILLGAAVALLCAFLTVIPGGWGVLPVNAVTPLLGVPVILYILLNSRRLSGHQ